MATYYNVESVKSNGRALLTGKGHQPCNHKLVMLLDNGFREIAANVTRKEEYGHFYTQYQHGMWLKYFLYDYDPSNEPD